MDKSEFTHRVTAMQDRLYRVSCGLLSERQDRMDAVQDAVLRAWIKRDKLRNEAWFETWLTRIVINACHDVRRAQRFTLPLESASEQAASEDTDITLRRAVLNLSEKLRMPIILHYMNGYDIRECARILRIPEGTVKTRLKRARDELRKQLEEEERTL